MRLQHLVPLALIAFSTITSGQHAQPLVLVQHIPLPGVEGRIDHLSVDLEQHRLYVAALGNNTVEVIDLKAGRRVESVTGVREPQGVRVIPSLGRLVIANGEGGDVQLRDTANLQKTAPTVPLSDDADNVRYDAKANRKARGRPGSSSTARFRSGSRSR